MTDFTYKRYGGRIPAVYGVYRGDTCLGIIEARHGRPGQSRSQNTYTAARITRRGAIRDIPGTYPSRRLAATALDQGSDQ